MTVEDKRAHLEMIQAVINRMSVNSFLLKGWSVGLVSALIAAGSFQDKPLIVLLAYFPSIIFWALDAYYLRQERLFRALYDQVRAANPEHTDYSMNTSVVEKKVSCWPRVAVSKTLLVFHGAVFGTIVVLMICLT